MGPRNAFAAPRPRAAAAQLALLAAAALCACSAPLFEVASERTRTPANRPVEVAPETGRQPPQALPRPTVMVEPPPAGADPVVASGTVVVHATEKSGLARLVVAPEDGSAGVHIFTYGPPGGLPLPVPSGSTATVRFYPQSPPLRRGWALVAEAADGALIGAVFSADGERGEGGWGLPEDRLPEGLDVAPHRKVAYSELKRLETLCLAMVDHHQVRVAHGGQFSYLRPGTWTELALPGGSYRLLVLDASVLVDARCEGERAGHFTFALLRARAAPAPPAASAGAAPPSASGPAPAD